MATNLALDDKLIAQAVKYGNHRSKKEAVTAALENYVRQKKARELIELFGTIEYDGDYDYTAARRGANQRLAKDA